MSSVKGNIILSVTNTVVGLLFPIVTFPYVSRVLMPEGIGTVQFYQSIINYIVLLSALGIPLYAVREIARVRDNEAERNRTALEILLLHAILSIIGYLIVFLLMATVAKIHAEWPLFLLLSLSIFFNVIGANWFYQAVEQFKYITIRSLVVRCLSAIALFTLIRTKNDLYTYAAILVCAEVGNYLFNFIRLRKYIRLKDFSLKELRIFRHLKPAVHIFMLNLTVSMYVNLNPIMLGFMTNDTCVGYYAAVRKIIAAGNGLTVALGTAILPRLSNYFAAGRIDEFHDLKKKALDVIILLCLPLSICTAIISPILIPVFSGDAYTPAILTLQLSSPTLLISAFNYIIGIQILYSQNKEKIVIAATATGAVVNIIMGFILIPGFLQNGAAVAGCLGELSVLIVCLTAGRRYIRYGFLNTNNFQVVLATLLCGAAMWATVCLGLNRQIVMLGAQVILGLTVYFTTLLLMKNDLLSHYIHALKLKILHIKDVRNNGRIKNG